jgi:hypothetical protein
MKRHRHHRAELEVSRNSAPQKDTQPRREGVDSPVLVKVNQFAKNPVVFAERECRVETAHATTAQGAPAILVERSRAQERRMALDTKMFRHERLRLCKALLANRNPGNVL